MPHRSILRCFVGSLCLAVVGALHGVAAGADDHGAAALTEPPEDDPNYALQGEFVGPVSTGENEYQALGLQVRSVGGGRFEARQFAGGLPGQENFQAKAVPLVGRRSGDFLVLSGGPWALFVEQDHCLLVDRDGERVGRLERIERRSPTLGAAPPEGAMVLFDGTGTDHFTRAAMSDSGLLKQGADFKPMVQDFDLHLEFRLPYMPAADGQSRGNSGVYLQSRYECQVLDSFAQETQINGCGALYRFKEPDLNMCLPPLVWQTYDIRFTAPRWAADGSKLRDAHVTTWLNGVKVQDNVAVPDKTGAGKPEAPTLLPTKLQDHRDPVRYRNVWMVDRGLHASAEFPIAADGSEAAEPAADAGRPVPGGTDEQPKPGDGDDDAKRAAEQATKPAGDDPPEEANGQTADPQERPQEESADRSQKKDPQAGEGAGDQPPANEASEAKAANSA